MERLTSSLSSNTFCLMKDRRFSIGASALQDRLRAITIKLNTFDARIRTTAT